MRSLEHSHFLMAACLGALVVAGSPASAKSPEGGRPAAAAAVQEALQREIYGDAMARQKLVAEASAAAADYKPAKWHSGLVEDGRRGWRRFDAALAPKTLQRLAEYERLRDSASATLEDQVKLANWCREEKMVEQERAHWTQVLLLNPDHVEARQRLGFQGGPGNWTSAAEAGRQVATEQARREALVKWQPLAQQLREGLEHRSPERRKFALEKMSRLNDAAAVPAIEIVFGRAQEQVAREGIKLLGDIGGLEAAEALGRIAAFAPEAEVRQAAAEELKRFEYDLYVPQMLAAMSSPITTRFMVTALPSGRIGYRHALSREGQSQQDVVVLDTEYRRQPLLFGDREGSRARALEDASAKAEQLESAAAAQNELITQLNDRLGWVLKIATGEDLPASPNAWWDWWNEVNEVFVTSKGVSVRYDHDQIKVVDEVSNPPPSSSQRPESSSRSTRPPREPGPPRRPRGIGHRFPPKYDCLAAGTVVWTQKGVMEIELIRVGDLVLAQHPETGELAYKPVLRTTVRPAGKLMKIEAGAETIETSGGHLFWVSGEGWRKSRELASGQVLHTVAGPLHVKMVEEGSEAETYNLEVADFNTYFVGYSKILSHDNTVRTPTSAIVPGLKP